MPSIFRLLQQSERMIHVISHEAGQITCTKEQFSQQMLLLQCRTQWPKVCTYQHFVSYDKVSDWLHLPKPRGIQLCWLHYANLILAPLFTFNSIPLCTTSPTLPDFKRIPRIRWSLILVLFTLQLFWTQHHILRYFFINKWSYGHYGLVSESRPSQ